MVIARGRRRERDGRDWNVWRGADLRAVDPCIKVAFDGLALCVSADYTGVRARNISYPASPNGRPKVIHVLWARALTLQRPGLRVCVVHSDNHSPLRNMHFGGIKACVPTPYWFCEANLPIRLNDVPSILGRMPVSDRFSGEIDCGCFCVHPGCVLLLRRV